MNTAVPLPDQVDIPDSATPYILFQRTTYQRLAGSLPYRILERISPVPLYKPSVFLEASLARDRIKHLYLTDMKAEYDAISEHLPDRCESVLDIGCGIAAINIFLQRHYGRATDFFLLDRSHMEDRIVYSLEERASLYSSLELAQEVLSRNGIDNSQIHLLETADSNDIHVEKPIDLVISLISWGFHYPVSVYLDEVYDVMATGGHLIMDVRDGTSGVDDIGEKFGNVTAIGTMARRTRVLAVKRAG